MRPDDAGQAADDVVERYRVAPPTTFTIAPRVPPKLAGGQFIDSVVQRSPTKPPATAKPLQGIRTVDEVGIERITIPPITYWDDLSCIRLLNRMHDRGDVTDRGYNILLRMCQTCWRLGHEVAIRKKVKLPRAQRLAKFQGFFDSLLEGGKVFQKDMKVQIRRAQDIVSAVPDHTLCKAFQDIEVVLSSMKEALR